MGVIQFAIYTLLTQGYDAELEPSLQERLIIEPFTRVSWGLARAPMVVRGGDVEPQTAVRSVTTLGR
jgi:hypothetical protein